MSDMSEDVEGSQLSQGQSEASESEAGNKSANGSKASQDDGDTDGEEGEDDESSIGSSSYESSKEPIEISPSERIRDLMAIDADVCKILQTAGEAMKILTNPDGSDFEHSKEAFTSKTRDYTVTVQTVAARLRRQVYALQEANIIPAQRTKPQSAALAQQPGRPGQSAQQPPMQITNGGLGNLDVGWLNSRSDVVGKQKEAELWAEARQHVENILGERPDDMDVDDERPG